MALQCPGCGTPIAGSTRVPRAASTPTAPPSAKGSKTGQVVLVAVLGVVFVAAGGLAVVGALMERGGEIVQRAATSTREIRVLADETFDLKEGEARSFSFSTTALATVHAEVTANPRSLDVYFMDASQVDAFEAALDEPGEKRFSYKVSPLSSLRVKHMRQSERVDAGKWALVVYHERESLIDLETTSVKVYLTVQ
jgi:hypothetical protein